MNRVGFFSQNIPIFLSLIFFKNKEINTKIYVAHFFLFNFSDFNFINCSRGKYDFVDIKKWCLKMSHSPKGKKLYKNQIGCLVIRHKGFGFNPNKNCFFLPSSDEPIFRFLQKCVWFLFSYLF